MRRTAIALIMALVVAPLSAVAEMTYSYAGASYRSLDLDDGDRVDGFGIEGSWAWQDNVHVIADFIRGKDDPTTVRRGRVGIGYNTPLNGTGADIFARVGASFLKTDAPLRDSDTSEGVFVELGLRGMATEDVEVRAVVGFDDAEDNLRFDVGGVYYISPEFGLELSLSHSSDIEIWQVGFRYNY